MKKKLFFVLIVCSIQAFAQDENVKGIIKLNPLSFLVSTINIAYEVPTSAKSSIQIATFYTSLGKADNKISGFGFVPEYRFYLSKTKLSPRGFYIAPTLRYSQFKYIDKNYNTYINNTYYSSFVGDFKQFGISANIGAQWVWKSGFNLDIYGGPSIMTMKYESNTGNEADTNYDGLNGSRGFGFVFGTRIGYAF